MVVTSVIGCAMVEPMSILSKPSPFCKPLASIVPSASIRVKVSPSSKAVLPVKTMSNLQLLLVLLVQEKRYTFLSY